MKKVYCVATCGTCQKIIKDADLNKKGFIIRTSKKKKSPLSNWMK